MKKFLFLFLFFYSIEALAVDPASTDTIMREIDKTALLSEGEGTAAAEKPQINIRVFEPMARQGAIKQKEELAYNASLINQDEIAVTLYKQVTRAEPKNTQAKFALAVIYQRMGQWRQAKPLYHSLLKVNLEEAEREQVTGNLLAILVEESPKESLYLLDRLAVENPQSSYILAQAGLAYSTIGQYEKAVNLLNRALKLEPEKTIYKFNLAVVYDRAGDRSKALETYQEVRSAYNSEENSGNGPVIPFEQVNQRIEFLRSATNS